MKVHFEVGDRVKFNRYPKNDKQEDVDDLNPFDVFARPMYVAPRNALPYLFKSGVVCELVTKDNDTTLCLVDFRDLKDESERATVQNSLHLHLEPTGVLLLDQQWLSAKQTPEPQTKVESPGSFGQHDCAPIDPAQLLLFAEAYNLQRVMWGGAAGPVYYE